MEIIKPRELTGTPMLRKALKRIPPGKALELGCGRGYDACYIASKGFSVTAVDEDIDSLEVAKIKAKEYGLKIEFVNSDIKNIEFPEDYSLIYSRHALHFLPYEDQSAIMERMKAHTSPGGFNIITVSMNSSDLNRVGFRAKEEGWIAGHYKDWEILVNVKDEKDFEKNGRMLHDIFIKFIARKPE